MKFNKWTVALAAIGVVSLASAARADEQPTQLSAVQTALSSTTLSGYVDVAATWRPGTDQIYSGPYLPAYAFAKNDGFSLNAVDIALNKPEDESPWAAGYHVELMAGPDAVPYGTGGWSNIRQAYVTLRTPVGNGIDWKIGVWDTIIGYESSSDPLNPNYTRSYAYSIEPSTHTGVLATYKANDMVAIQAGVADSFNGINETSGIESRKAYMGDIQFTAPDSAGWLNGATLTVGAIDAATSRTWFYAGATLPTPVKALKVGASFDYLDIHDSAGAVNPSNDSVWNIALYSSFQATDKLSFNLRGEYLSDQLGLADILAKPFSYAAVGGGGNAVEEITATAQYQMWANVISRVEFRWDHVEHGTPFGVSTTTGAPFRGNDFLLALNLIYQF
jgi:hypothetical protein